jgi:hypothetical protein
MKRSSIIILSICCIATTAIVGPYISHLISNQKNPDLIITHFGQFDNGYVGRDVVFEMDLSNQGLVTAKNCMITLFDGKTSSPPIISQFFDVMPTPNNTPIKIKSGIYDNTGIYKVRAELGCMNTKSQSAAYTLEVAQ